MQAVGQDVHVGVSPRHQPAIVPDDAIDLVERKLPWLLSRSDAVSISHASALARLEETRATERSK